MITTDTYRRVADIISETVDNEALSRFGRLGRADISEKNPGDLVTIADTRTENALTEQLEKMLPGSVTVGEEACETNPALLDVLATDTPAWIIDPIDGTANYARGNPDYSCLVALARNGTVYASWLYAPSLGLTAGAHTGHGAWIDDEPAAIAAQPRKATLNIVTSHPNYTGGYHDIVTKLDTPRFHRTPCNSAGLSYIDLIQGRYDALVYTWEKPWDHATGLHIYSTLGGINVTMDGRPFSITGGNTLPFIVGGRAPIDAILAPLTN